MTEESPTLYPIPDERYAGYKVTRCGKVWSDKSGRFLAGCVGSDKYHRVTIRNRGVSVHTLIALTFLGPRPSKKHLILHDNDDRLDNRADNLRYGTGAENHEDAYRNGKRRLSPQTIEIRRLTEEGVGRYDISRRLNVPYATVCYALGDKLRGVTFTEAACKKLPPAARDALATLAALDPKFQTLLEWTQC